MGTCFLISQRDFEKMFPFKLVEGDVVSSSPLLKESHRGSGGNTCAAPLSLKTPALDSFLLTLYSKRSPSWSAQDAMSCDSDTNASCLAISQYTAQGVRRSLNINDRALHQTVCPYRTCCAVLPKITHFQQIFCCGACITFTSQFVLAFHCSFTG